MDLHNKYRPRNFDELIGQEKLVTRLRGIVKSGKIPPSILFLGPTSAGKTTMARCFAAELNGKKDIEGDPNFREVDGTTSRSIDDLKSVIRVASFKAMGGGYRTIVIDEFQQVISNAQAVPVLLKPFEEPPPRTVWIACSMDPSKFTTGNGKALANRMSRFNLEAPTEADLKKYAIRIMRGEKMGYAKPLIQALVEGCSQEMRTLAGNIEAVQQYYDGLKKKPAELSVDCLDSALSSLGTDDGLVGDYLVALYEGDFKSAHRATMDISDPVQFINKLVWGSSFLLNLAVVPSGRHRKIWWNAQNKALQKRMDKVKLNFSKLSRVHAGLIDAKARSMTFTIPADELLSSVAFNLIHSSND